LTDANNSQSIIDECYLNAERSSQVRSAIDRDAAWYRLLCQEKKASVQLSRHQFFKKVDEMLSESTFFAALKSAAVGGSTPRLGKQFQTPHLHLDIIQTPSSKSDSYS
jgi:hypothetical protein